MITTGMAYTADLYRPSNCSAITSSDSMDIYSFLVLNMYSNLVLSLMVQGDYSILDCPNA